MHLMHFGFSSIVIDFLFLPEDEVVPSSCLPSFHLVLLSAVAPSLCPFPVYHASGCPIYTRPVSLVSLPDCFFSLSAGAASRSDQHDPTLPAVSLPVSELLQISKSDVIWIMDFWIGEKQTVTDLSCNS